MDTLQSYLSMVDSRLLHQLTGKTKEFIRVFQEENYISENAFMNRVCGERHKQRYYYYLKANTITILQAFAMVSRSTGVNTVQKKLDFCRKNFTVGQKFLERGVRGEGLGLIRQAYKIAVEYDFAHLACELSSVLHHNHVYYHRNKYKAEFYASQVEKYLRDYTAEKKAESYFYQVVGKYKGSLKSIEYEESLAKINEYKGESLKYKTYKGMIEVFYGFSINDFDLIIESCSKTLDSFKGKKGVYFSHYLFFLMNIGKAHMAIGDYGKATINFKESESYALTKSINYALIQLHKALNALHAGEYQLAYDLYLKNRKCRFDTVKEQFAIMEAYLCYLSHTGHLKLKGKFRLGKLLNETIKAQTDKEGSNVNIIIAELLVYLGRDRGKFIDRVEAVNSYSYRHLKSPETRRAKRFIKILCTLPKVNFHPVALQRVAKRHIDYLKTHPISMGQNVSIEILPFETVLEMILVQLLKKVA
ncbi:MAG: hypothetical protein AB8G15_05415 [Saprospiraceae bacterium]